jgi:hypothetical protein
MSDKVTLTDQQMYNLVEQYVQIKVDRMTHQDLEEHVKENLTDYYCDWSIDELETIIEEELLEELVDNVTTEIAPSKVTITDDDYADKVDTFVGNMVASDDNVFTHDSEGC